MAARLDMVAAGFGAHLLVSVCKECAMFEDDWRIPTLDEMRTLIDGVSTSTAGGFCPTSQEFFRYTSCSTNPKNDDAGSGCSAVTGFPPHSKGAHMLG